MNVYKGQYARLYDLFYAEKPYDDEVEATDRLLRANAKGPSQRLLDVACGTGQHAVRFAARGWDVVGVDQSHDMLRRARERDGGSAVTFVEQDMRRLDLPAREFDAAICLFDSIGYGVTNDAIVETMTAVHRHLRREGLFVVEFWHAPPMLRDYEPIRVRRWDSVDGSVLRISRTTLDVAAQLARVEYSVYQLYEGGRYEFSSEAHENQFFLIQEMDLLLRASGFEAVRWMAGYSDEASIDGATWHVVVCARRHGSDTG